MKSLTGAMESMTETRHAFQLIYNELLEEQVKIYLTFLDCSTVGLSYCRDQYTLIHRLANRTAVNQQNLVTSPLAPLLD